MPHRPRGWQPLLLSVILGLDPRTHAPPHVLAAKKHVPHFPHPSTPCLQSPIPPRIHRKALRRGGVGAGREGATHTLTHRARGKWSPSGETGEMAGRRTGPPFCPDHVAGRACVAHNMAAAPCGVRGLPRSHGAVEDGADRQSWLRHRDPEGVHDPFFGRARHRSHAPRHRREAEVAGKNRRTGRWTVPHTNIQSRQPPAPRPNAP